MVVVILKCMAENLQVRHKEILSHLELFFLSRKFLFEFISSVLDFHSWFVASCRSQPGSSSSSSIYSVRLYLCVGIYLLTN